MAQLSDLLRRNDELERRQNERLVRFHFRRSSKNPNRESFNISRASGAQLGL